MLVESWREVVPADEGQLLTWICTDPAKERYIPGLGKRHPRRWELDVQSYFRNDCRAYLRSSKLRQNALLWSGWMGETLGGIAHLEYVADYDATMILAYSRAIHFRGRGLGVELLEECERLVADPERRVHSETIVARVHNDNAVSFDLFMARGYDTIDIVDDYRIVGKDFG